VHERYRQTTDDRRQTDGRTTTYSEHEHEFTFAKNDERSMRSTTKNVSVCCWIFHVTPSRHQSLEIRWELGATGATWSMWTEGRRIRFTRSEATLEH